MTDIDELSDEEFEEKYKTKKPIYWDEVKTKGLRQDPKKPAYISKIKKEDLAAEDTEMNEGKFTQEEVQKAIRIAMHMKGDMTDATDAIDAIHPGLTKHPEVEDALKQANESTEEVVAEGPTRKDFQMVADLLKDNPNMADRKAKAKEYCDKFAKMNPRFDKERFLKACGVTEAIEEDDFEEGNEFSGALAQAKKDGKQEFEVDGKVYKVTEDELEAILRLAR